MNVTATFTGRDQNWQDESTTYWFTLSGTDYGTKHEFDESVYGISESSPESTIVDADGCPLTAGDAETIAVLNSIAVTDEIRKEASGL